MLGLLVPVTDLVKLLANAQTGWDVAWETSAARDVSAKMAAAVS